MGNIVFADDPIAMPIELSRWNFEPGRIVRIRKSSTFMGNASPGLLDQVGEILAPLSNVL